MSLAYTLSDSVVAKTIGSIGVLLLNPIVSAAVLTFLTRAPDHIIQDLLQRAFIPAKCDLTFAKTIIKALFAIGVVRSLNAKLSSMAANSWRFSSAPGWHWPAEIAVVTGGSSGIGLAIVQKLLKKGIKVAVFDIQALPDNLKNNSAVRYYHCDVSSTKSISTAAADVRHDFGDPTILVNNAGIVGPKNIIDIEEMALQKIFSINTISHWMTVQQFLPAMIKANKGHIVTMASLSSFSGLPGHADYSATRASALAFHESLRSELKCMYDAPNVMTTIVHPNFVATPLVDGFKSHLRDSGVTFLTPSRVAEDTTAQIFHRKGGHVIIPKSYTVAAALRSWPTWMQVAITDIVGARASKLNASRK